jgi:hypothetical protein
MYPGMRAEEKTSFEPYSAFDIPADLRELHGRYDVEATALRVRNFRYAEEWLMMMLGGWIATIPELPVKTGLGKIIWETAKIADELGKRLPELRCGKRSAEAASKSSNPAFVEFIEEVSGPETPDLTIEKIAGAFDVLLPHQIEVYEQTMRETDQICDAPTIELLDDAVRRKRQHVAWATEVLDRLCDTDQKRERRSARASEVNTKLEASGGVTGTLAADRGTIN